jgi:hypothetical protein
MSQNTTLEADLSPEVVAKLGNATAIGSIDLDPTVVPETEEKLGDDLVVNGDFANWTGTPLNDQPDGWTVSESVPNAYVTQVGNACRMVSDGTAVNMTQGPFLAGVTYRMTADVDDVTTGSLTIEITGGGGAIGTFDTVGAFQSDFTPLSDGNLNIKRPAACDVTFTNVCVRAFRTVPNNGKLERLEAQGNGFAYPNDLTQSAWTRSNCASSTANAIIADTSTLDHSVRQSVAVVEGKNVIGVEILEADKTWLQIRNNDVGSGMGASFDLASEAVGTVTADKGAILGLGDGYKLLIMEGTFSAGTENIRFYPAESDTDLDYTGDDSTVDVYVRNIYSLPGTIVDNIQPDFTGGAAPVPVETKWRPAVDKQFYWDAGIAFTADGRTVVAADVDGELMEESAGNVDVLREADKWKKVSDNTWGDMVPNVPYWSPKKYGSANPAKRMFLDNTSPVTPTPVVATSNALHGGQVIASSGTDHVSGGSSYIATTSFFAQISRNILGTNIDIVLAGGYTVVGGYFDWS